MDCILGYHLNPLACGIAKFNHALANELGVPVLSLFDPSASSARRPLLSIKLSEFTYNHGRDLERFLDERPATQSLRLFLHAYDETDLEKRDDCRGRDRLCGQRRACRAIEERAPRRGRSLVSGNPDRCGAVREDRLVRRRPSAWRIRCGRVLPQARRALEAHRQVLFALPLDRAA